MKIIKNLFFTAIIGLGLTITNQGIAGQVSISGTVTKVNNNTITIETIKAEIIPKGSRVDLFLEISEGSRIEVGQWKVSGRGKGIIFATPVDMIGPPQKGMTAKISYSEKKNRVQVTGQDHYNAPPISQNDAIQEKKQFVDNTQQYVDKVRKIVGDLRKNSKKYSTDKIQTLEQQIVQNVKKAVAGDNAEAYYLLALLHEDGVGEISRDSKKMVENLIISAKKGYGQAQYILGDMYKSGDEVVKDKKKAVYWLKKAAGQGHQDAKMELKLMEPEIRGKEPEGQLLGIPFPAKSAKEYATAGDRFYHKKNYKSAFKEYEQCARMGHSGCQLMLGTLYNDGLGVVKDLNKARELYEKSARKNNSNAIYNLGVLYLNGSGVKKDMAKAHELFLKSANLGYPEAQFNLGATYYNGMGVKKDNSTALKWFRKAADQNISKALYVVGQAYESGWGTPKNMSKAKEYYKKAAELGDKAAIKKLNSQ